MKVKMKKKQQFDPKEEEKQRKCTTPSSNTNDGATTQPNNNIVIVGMKMSSQGKELLTWALVKIAKPGDTVIALHVLPKSKDSVGIDGKSSSCLLSLVQAFDSVLGVYEGFCNLKQIELKMKVCRGSSIRRVLVQEVKSYSASSLVVGVTKNNRAIGYSPVSTATYCAKKLPQNCSIFAVNNGRIVFCKEAVSDVEPAEYGHSSLDLRTENKAVISKQFARKSNAFISSLNFIRPKSRSSSSTNITAAVSSSQNLAAPLSSGPKGKEIHGIARQKSDSFALVAVKKPEFSKRSLSRLFRDISERKPGWPLLHKAVFAENKTALPEKSKISVVQWAMQLPSRYSVTSVMHPSQSSVKKGIEAFVPDTENELSPSSLTSNGENTITKELESLKHKYSSVCRLFRYDELMQITCNFSAENLIGRGGSSRVYKGVLSDGKELAVKILKPSEDSINEFASEINIITSLRHKNIISLLGFCFENDKLILVYNFLSRGSLEDNLHGENNCRRTMNWEERYKIAIGVAEALSYLHGGENAQPVIHRDVKSSNILLNDNFEPQLSDFGLAKWASDSATEMDCRDIAGTFGYLAPEYFMYGKVNEKIDVYAFGVVLLELISGRKPVNTGSPKGQESLVVWANLILQGGKVEELVDPCLGTNCDANQLDRMILAASLCIKRSPRHRPLIELVLKILQGDYETVESARALNTSSKNVEDLEGGEAIGHCNIQSHINLALLDIDEDSTSVSSNEPSVEFPTTNKSLEEYLQGRWSRSSSFD